MFKAGRAYFDGYGCIVHLRDHGNPRWPFTDGTRYFDENGKFSGGNRKLDLHEFLRPMPTGPVVTETVTKTRIVPGVYDHVEVAEPESYDGKDLIPVAIGPCAGLIPMTADELDAAAAVLSALAKGLRDA